MNKIRQIIKFYSQRTGKKRIGTRLSISKNTVKLYIYAYLRLQRPWEEISLLTRKKTIHLLEFISRYKLLHGIEYLFQQSPDGKTITQTGNDVRKTIYSIFCAASRISAKNPYLICLQSRAVRPPFYNFGYFICAEIRLGKLQNFF